jgi:hypothetical protein
MRMLSDRALWTNGSIQVIYDCDRGLDFADNQNHQR